LNLVSLQPFFKGMESLAVYKSSIYLGPGVNLVHLVSMCTFMGALLMVDLRLMGAGLTTQSVKQVARSARPWLIGGLIGLTLTGIPALMATATQQYANKIFWFKMYVLFAALIFTFTVRRKVTAADEGRVGPVWGRLVALVSIVLWMSVAAGGRLIMYL
jgi:hypothetical protein